jgi:hypothetical protein
MAKKIKFTATNEFDFATDDAPMPSAKAIPQWYKDIPSERPSTHPENGAPTFGRSSSTVKKCVPFTDALSSGYTWTLPFDIGIDKNEYDGSQTSYWKVNRATQYAMVHDLWHRHTGIAVPDGYSPIVWRLELMPRITTPPGYSVLVTHPLNRYDLPFLALSGVVDTDKSYFQLPVNLYLRADFHGVIPKGTPMVQIIPFKRENWKSEYASPVSALEEHKAHFKHMSILDRSYQTQFWSKKKYE